MGYNSFGERHRPLESSKGSKSSEEEIPAVDELMAHPGNAEPLGEEDEEQGNHDERTSEDLKRYGLN